MPKQDSIGALWLRESKNGNKYMSGVVEFGDQKINIVVFKNTYKKEGKHPDYRILKSEKQTSGGEGPENFESDVPF